MAPPNDIIAPLALLAGALALGWLGASVLGNAGLPGGRRASGLVGGLLIGLLGGAGGLFALAPGTYDAWFRGGTDQARALADFDDETDAGLAGLRTSGVTPVAIDEYREQRTAARAPLERTHEEALDARSGALDTTISLSLGLMIVLASPYWLPRARPASRLTGIGVFVGVVLLAALAGTMQRATSFTAPAWAIATLGCVFACLCSAPSARASGSLIAWSVLPFFVCVTGARLLGLMTAQGHGVSPITSTMSVVVLLLVIGWLPYQLLSRAGQRRLRRPMGAVAYRVLVPAVVVLSVARLDTGALWSGWTVWIALLVAALVSSDLRWYALATVMRSVGRKTPYTDAERCANPGAGIAQLVIAIALHDLDAINDTLFLALLVGAAIGEMTVCFRARLALAMQRGEPLTDVFGPTN